MRVVVTGANGHLGRVVVALLLAQGMEVLGVDKERDRKARFHQMKVDLCDLGQVFGALAGADAVVHLGAIPSPNGFPPEVVYTNNVTGQFNVFEVAAKLGITRVVSASSVSAFGFPFQHRWSEPLYLPLDEVHPLLPQDAYGLSKANGEEIAAAYTRRTGSCAVSLRISTVVDDTTIHRFLEYMRHTPGEWPQLLWSYVHIDDVAQACLLSLTRPLEGHQIFHITSNDTLADQPTDELLERWFPKVPRHITTEEAYWSLIDGQKAASMLGYLPRYRWSEALGVTRPGRERSHTDQQEDQQ
jgi:UDP-glucose 4-epimerase